MWIMQPCPLHKEVDNETYCILDDEFDDVILINFLYPSDLQKIDISEFQNPLYCLNAVITDKEDFVFCPTKNKRIKIGDMSIPRKIYMNTREVILFMDPEAQNCSECLYKAFVAMKKSVEKI
ncbi:MAG: hypothetical protein KAS47_02055 [Candidatus Heimdallarchaeota archaeon]|nr:hypothetical protein [Candidatus Heimdallarchaeota archaeon]MCK4973121.1 hypothetical protein [Candidatus Heimdallarchaeota archaeon]